MRLSGLRMEAKRTLIHLISTNRWGGAQRYALDICTHFLERGWRVAAVTRDAKVVDDPFRKAGVPLEHSPLRGFFDPSSVMIMAKMLKGQPVNRTCVHVHRYRDAFTVLLAKRLIGRPDVRIISTRHKIRKGRNSWLFRRIYDKVNAHIFVSKTAFERFASTWKQLPMRRDTVHILHNSIKLAVVPPEPEPDRGPLFAVYNGPLVAGKGLETLIDALGLLKESRLRLRIAGKGNPDYIDSLRRRAMNRGVMDKIDWKNCDDISTRLLSQSHFAVFPSVEREAFGIGNLHAMALGRAQVCTANGAQGEYLEEGKTALFAKPADASSLASAIASLASEKERRQQIGRNAFRTWAETLSWSAYIRRLTEIYTTC